jgi:circadian clock protein KaiB
VTAPGGGTRPWSLTLYVSGASLRSAQALDTVRRICDEALPGQVDLRVVDVAEDPALVSEDEVLAVPALVRWRPAPVRRLVGDLADVDRVRAGLDLAAPPSPSTARSGPPGEP